MELGFHLDSEKLVHLIASRLSVNPEQLSIVPCCEIITIDDGLVGVETYRHFDNTFIIPLSFSASLAFQNYQDSAETIGFQCGLFPSIGGSRVTDVLGGGLDVGLGVYATYANGIPTIKEGAINAPATCFKPFGGPIFSLSTGSGTNSGFGNGVWTPNLVSNNEQGETPVSCHCLQVAVSKRTLLFNSNAPLRFYDKGVCLYASAGSQALRGEVVFWYYRVELS